MKNNMIINVEFLAGTSLDDALVAAKSKAEFWDVLYIQFKFNGVELCIGRNANIDNILAKWGSMDGAASNFICCP